MNPHTNKLKISIFVYVVLLVGVFSTLAVVIKQNNTSNTAPTASQTPSDTKAPDQNQLTPDQPVASNQYQDDDDSFDDDDDRPNTRHPLAPGTTPTPTVPSNTSFKDGTYTATGSYMSPAGMENVGVSVTLKNNIITEATVTNEARNRTSVRYQNMFIQNFTPLVVGKNITSVHLDVVGDSSLTGAGFNQALATIEASAKA